MYKYTHLIPENIAPVGAETIGFYDGNGRRVGGIGVGKLSSGLSKEDKLYSFGAISDAHITYDTSTEDLKNALNLIEKSGCDFTCICGDLTDNGSKTQMAQYKSIIEEFSQKDVYAIVGNHENYSYYKDTYNIADYTGYPLYYSFEYNNDVFIMCGCYAWYEGNTEYRGYVFNEKYLQWLDETIEANREKRCFVFCHVFPFNDGVGNVKVNGKWIYSVDMWTSKDGYDKVFESIISRYGNVVLFHGHSHLKFDLQEVDKNVNYAYVKKGDGGYHSIHIPSLCVPRDINASGTSYTNIYAESEGYIVDVYKDCIVLNGIDFGKLDTTTGEREPMKQLAIATYKIDTTLQTIAPNTFTDPTGTRPI